MKRRWIVVLWVACGAIAVVSSALWVHARRDVVRLAITGADLAPAAASPWQIDLGAVEARRSWLDRLAGTWTADSSTQPTASRATLLADGEPIGSAHALHDALARGVRGWSHWSVSSGSVILFGTGDDADPRRDGATIELVLPASPRPIWPLLAALSVLVPTGTLVANRLRAIGPGSSQLGALASAHGPAVAATIVAAGIGIAAIGPLVDAPHDAWRRWIVAALMAAAGLRAGRMVVPGFALLPMRVLAIMLALYAATATINAPRAVLASSAVATLLEPAPPWTGVPLVGLAALAALAWFRPACLALLVAVVAWKRSAAVALTGFPNVSADWLPVAIAANVLVGGAIVAAWIRPRATPASTGAEITPPDATGLFAALLPLAAALQLGNYVASAWEKIRISPGWIEWIAQNRSEMLVRVADALDVWTPARALGLDVVTHGAMASSAIAVNVLTLLIELFPLVAVFRRRWMVAALLVATGLHGAIWFATGLFFWKWIVLDAALAAGLWRMRRAQPDACSRSARLLGGAALLAVMLAQPWIVETVRLGWFDTPALNRVRYEAVLADGRTVPVPSDFFASGSYRVACGVFPPAGGDFFPTDTWATTDDFAVKRSADEGTPAVHPSGAFAASCAAAEIDGVLRRHHAWALEHATSDGRATIGVIGNFWPHHIASDGGRFHEFAATDLRDIVAYRIVAEAVWLDHPPDGRVVAPRVVLRDVHEVPVEAPGG